MTRSKYLQDLDQDRRSQLEQRLLARQSRHCFICDEEIDLVLHKGQLDVDHIDPLANSGLDSEQNFALTHASCNRSKGASNLQVARRLAEFERLQDEAQREGKRGANLGDILARYGGGKDSLRVRCEADRVEYALPAAGVNTIQRVPVWTDPISGVKSFFAALPLAYVHHDDRINPRSIGANIRGLIEEFQQKRPQLHVALAWWAPDAEGAGRVEVFDGQHKAAAQILLGAREIIVRVFLEPDLDVLLVTNVNAGSKLRQVAFDQAVMRHLGSSLYLERVRQYRSMRGLTESDWSFSEQDLVKFFRGEQRALERYIIDAQRDSITQDPDNKLLEFVEWAGKGADRPMAYSALDGTFFREFVYKKALETPIGEGLDEGTNPRWLEREQLVRMMSLFAEVFFVSHWDPDLGGRKLESNLQAGDNIAEGHLRAWRITREEVLGNVTRWMRLVIANYFAYTGKVFREERPMHVRLPDELWTRMRNFLESLAALPCWIDRNLGQSVFGPKQNLDYWDTVFRTGRSPSGVQVLAKGLDLQEMVKGPKS